MSDAARQMLTGQAEKAGRAAPGLRRSGQSREAVVFGRMRRVNPEAGEALAALAGRLMAVSEDDGQTWELRLLERGIEFSTRRPLMREELLSLSGGLVGPQPWAWRWVGVERGSGRPVRLTPPARPTSTELALLADEAARLCRTRDDGLELPRIDPVEVWLGDRESGRPIALAATAVSREWALALPHIRPWQCLPIALHTPETWAFQCRVNARINRSPRPERFRFVVRVYERTPEGVIRHGVEGPLGQVRPGMVPSGILAEPFESERLAVLGRLPASIRPEIPASRPTLAHPGTAPPARRLGAVEPMVGVGPTAAPLAASG